MLRPLCIALLVSPFAFGAAHAQAPAPSLAKAGLAEPAPSHTALAKAGLLDADPAEVAAIEAAIGLYFRGHATGDGAYFARVFHPDARLFWAADGALRQRPVGEWIAGAPGAPAEDEAQRRRRIVSLDVAGSVAAARVELDYPGALIHDYFALVKADGRWQIVNKVFAVERRAD